MVTLNKIYTRTGDDGSTALGNGQRRKKYDTRVAAYGTVDETNAVLGCARVLGPEERLDKMLARIQNDLFDLGADLATPHGAELPYEPLRIVSSQVDRLEREIDDLNGSLAPLKSFVLPGGSPLSAQLHLARTVSRRAERLMVELAAHESVGEAALRYMNRLSDFLFVAARIANRNGADDVLWVPGQSRGV
ncbi:cob(I)yrinic acid a,c-diamide adenosyltransferase [Acuticoccus sp. M5D2P5]|uniref:cob(I)yrinic acid a,c-diamide adenosyltransferase n=1 Tax=Acuticoccus kalidii TaxID=2910977 RepID=UPI001F452A96|nr:cob(I)yrinic acid a,c-diamide adenosyltransferase [Acuticoccus kalidii]MCF3933374.1 cob(I)yrinic acid a,c-diamide adenosyltransferase [Acuticoccus kalidii]